MLNEDHNTSQKLRNIFLAHCLLSMVISFPSYICDNIAPIACLLASISKMNDFVKFGCVRIGSPIKLSFRWLNAV